MSDDTVLQCLPTHVLSSTGYRRERWRNGMGWTREILRLPRQGDDWVLRLSIAEIESDAAFSRFPGVERELVLLHGNGVRLRFEDGRVEDVLPPHGRVRFGGEAAVHGELVDGTTHDFNVMWRRDRVAVQLLHRPLVGPMYFFTEPGVAWAIHMLAGQAAFAADTALPALEQGDTAWLAAGARQRHALQGGGEVLAIRVSVDAATAGRHDAVVGDAAGG